jgi:zinc finger SWIM domain-containing protein 3
LCAFDCIPSTYSEKLGITSDERFLALEIFQKLAYAKSENAYFEIYEELKQTNLESVIRFFNDNWHPIRSE